MRLEDRIKALWRLSLERSAQGRRFRRRGAATAAMAVFVVVLLVALGLAWFVLLVLATGIACALLLAGGMQAYRYRVEIAAAAADSKLAAVAAMRTAMSSTRIAAAHARVRGQRGIDSGLPHLRRHWSRAYEAAVVAQRSVTSRPVDRQRAALRANATGAALRRQGSSVEAAEHHRVALELFRELGDRSGEALTLNNLALALDRAGDGAAIELFEQAARLLDELGERQHEGQVMANLALAFRRRGKQDESREVLDLALERLTPDSSAYLRVEELRRAS